MRVVFTVVGEICRPANLEFDLDVIPREGETVYFQGSPRSVRTVVHHPEGTDGETVRFQPYVYIVLGPSA